MKKKRHDRFSLREKYSEKVLPWEKDSLKIFNNVQTIQTLYRAARDHTRRSNAVNININIT